MDIEQMLREEMDNLLPDIEESLRNGDFEIMAEPIEGWHLEASFHVECFNCTRTEEVIRPTAEEAVKVFKGLGWHVRRVGPWCPECASLLHVEVSRPK